MATAAANIPHAALDEQTYKRRIFAWTMYDWANSAFATTILAAVLPIYYSQVAGATLPSDAIASAYWSFGLSASLIIAAIISPILGTVSDVMRGKKLFLSIFAGMGIIATALLVFVGTGDWLIASIIAIVGRIGFTGSISFYDALLQHVAREKDRDSVSARGYAMGYLGGGILLAINVVMIFQLGFENGARLSFLSVAIWWAIFTIPLLRQVPEPPSATEKLKPGQTVIGVSFQRIRETLKDVAKYRELVKYLVAFLIYNDAIGTIIGVSAIYGAELGFEATSLILALLLVQFVGIPFSLIFGSLPNPANKRRAFFMAFIVFNLVVLPIAGIVGANVLPQNVTGVLLPPYPATDLGVGTGVYNVDELILNGDWTREVIPAATLGTETDTQYAIAADTNSQIDFPFNGREVTLTYSAGPDHGIWAVLMDGQPLLVEDEETDQQVPLEIDAYNATLRYGVTETFAALEPGDHTLSLVNTGRRNEASSGDVFAVGEAEVLKPVSESSLLSIIGGIIILQLIGLAFAWSIGRHLFAGIVETMDTRRSIILALIVYSVIAVWGFILNSTIEFWFLAWMVAIVQGGSQALSRSLFAAMSPASKSGEFFGLFGVMEKFASFIGPLLFTLAVLTLGSSRPAILALIAFFIIGGYLLTRVNIEEGKRVAEEEDKAAAANATT